MTALKTETGRAAVLTLESLARRLDELAERAFDVSDRYTGETDAELAAKISVLSGIADECVWSCHTDYSDESGLERMRFASEKAGKAWSFLRSPAPAIQRTLKEPSPEDREFIAQRLAIRSRSGSAYFKTYGTTLEWLKVPGMRVAKLDSVLFSCTNAAQVRRVLRAVGLDFTAGPDAETLICAGDSVERRGGVSEGGRK